MADRRPRRTLVHIALGGTIACVQTRAGLVPRLRAEALLARARVPAGVRVRAIDMAQRTTLSPADWVALARSVARVHDACDGIVVTLGTDTLAYAAAALAVILRHLGKPVVLTGAMRPMAGARSDGPRNLSDALRVASARGIAGVLVVFAGRILAGSAVSKTRTAGDAAFESVTGSPLGRLTGDRIVWRVRPAASGGRLALSTRLETRVATCKLTPAIDRAFVEALARHRGVLVEGYGDGNVPDELVAALSRLARRRLVVLASQCTYGRVRHRYAGGRALLRAGALSSGGATKETALARLMWALGRSRNRAAARRLFLAAGAARRRG